MKFSTSQDIEAPIEAVFDMLCDYESFERSAMGRGAEVRRVDTLRAPGVGMMWNAAFDLRGKRRDVEIEIITFERPTRIVLECGSASLNAILSLDLMALSRSRTRVLVGLEVKPQNLSGRLLVQSMKLTKASLITKYEQRVADYAKSIEERYESAV